MVTSAQAASEKHAKDIVILDLRNLSNTADYFFICSAQSVRQACAIADHLSKRLSKSLTLHHVEGYPETGWILLDYGEVIVHVFQDDVREHYDLEGLWSDAERVKIPGESRSSTPVRRKVGLTVAIN